MFAHKESRNEEDIQGNSLEPDFPFIKISHARLRFWPRILSALTRADITISIIEALSLLPQLHVKACCLTTPYKNRKLNLKRIRHDLDVKVVLAGTVFKIKSRLVVKIELVDIENGYHLWSERYEHELTDIRKAKKNITKEISEDLRACLAQPTH